MYRRINLRRLQKLVLSSLVLCVVVSPFGVSAGIIFQQPIDSGTESSSGSSYWQFMGLSQQYINSTGTPGLSGTLRQVRVKYDEAPSGPSGGSQPTLYECPAANTIYDNNGLCNVILAEDPKIYDSNSTLSYIPDPNGSEVAIDFGSGTKYSYPSGMTTFSNGYVLNSLKYYTFWLGSLLSGGYGDIKGLWSGGKFYNYVILSDDNTESVTSDISTSTVWYKNHIYLVDGIRNVDAGSTLTIEPGTVVKFVTATSSIVVEGVMTVGDSSASTTRFTSIKDDKYRDSNGDLGGSAPSAGNWGSISVNVGGVLNMENTEILYGGTDSTSTAMILNNGGTISLYRVAVANSFGIGIETYAGTTSVSESTLTNNDTGLHIVSGTTTIEDSSIHSNNYFGINNVGSDVLDARGLGWATSSGPMHSSNPLGSGDRVSDNVLFLPFDTGSHFTQLDNSVRGTPPVMTIFSTSTYRVAEDFATSTWNALGHVSIQATTSSANADLFIKEVYVKDVDFVGKWTSPGSGQDELLLNSWYLSTMHLDQQKMTLIHELGHALGLSHSYYGNIMNPVVTYLTNLGPQDYSDYYYLW